MQTTPAERRHMYQRLAIVRDKTAHFAADKLLRLVADANLGAQLMEEALEALCDGDQAACNCARTDGQKIVIPAYSGNCLICRLRAAVRPEQMARLSSSGRA